MITVERIQSGDLLAKAHHIRKVVFVVEQNCPEDIEWEFEDESTHYIALENGEAVGTARWRKTANGIKFERFAVLKEHRNKEVGKALLLRLIADTNDFGQKRYLHAQLTAKNFYLRNGFQPEGEHFWEADIEHVKMSI
ncbi:MAG: GNAT family N-acetyltransferase [Bacteroidota bacterium]